MKVEDIKLNLEIIQILATDLNCDIDWVIDLENAGEYDVFNGHVLLSPEIFRDESVLWSVVFHELEHVKAAKKGIWYDYHHAKWNMPKLARQRLKVERYIDKKAKETMKIYFPELKFTGGY